MKPWRVCSSQAVNKCYTQTRLLLAVLVLIYI
jgi:hypothetical protein